MGRTSKILSPAEVRERKQQEKDRLTAFKNTAKVARTNLKDARASLREASKLFNSAEREAIKAGKAVAKQQEKVDALKTPRASAS